MKITRREILRSIAGALTACVASLTSWRMSTAQDEAIDSPEALSRGIDALRSRDYSETGVPMILGLEDLSSDATRTSTAAGNAHLVEAFDRYVELYLQSHPDATANDVAAVVEFIAHRDFVSGGRPFSL